MLNDLINHAILNKAAKYRGWAINGTVALERLIDVYIVCYFTNDSSKQEQLLELVFASSAGAPSFDAKRNIFSILLKKHNKVFYNNNKTFLEDISWVIKRRNVLAHYQLNRSDEAEKKYLEFGQIGFIKYKEVTETIWWDDKMVEELANKIEDCIEKVSGLIVFLEDGAKLENPIS